MADRYAQPNQTAGKSGTALQAADILVVDDTIESLRLLTEILSAASYQVRSAERPQMALQSALAHPPTLILLDVRMPHMNGFELCRHLKADKRTSEIPVIFVSALQDTDDKVEGFEAGGVDFISKPFEESEVLARVRTHLQLRMMQQHLEERVVERTAELTEANVALKAEIAVREEAEKAVLVYQDRLKALAAELTMSEERERRRIATHLHDEVGQALAFARIQIATARKAKSEHRRNGLLDDASQTLLETIRATRHLVYDLSSPLLNEIGLEAAISQWADKEIKERHSLDVHVIDDGYEKPLSQDVEAILFRNVRELLTNVVKHAHASSVVVRVMRVGDTVRISVSDDGQGMDTDAAIQDVAGDGGFGLFSIQERMSDLGGSLETLCRSGEGCTMILCAPLAIGQPESESAT